MPQTTIGELLGNQPHIERLLRLEKERRGVPKDGLVFVGTSNVAHYYWCAMQAVFRSRREEEKFFLVYLQGRWEYALELGLIDRLPKDDEALLAVGNEVTHRLIEELLKKRACQKEDSGTRTTIIEEFYNERGEKVTITYPHSDKEPPLISIETAEGVRIADLEEFPILRGEFLHELRGEKYPTIRWNFPWGRYVVVGVPDGITDRFVYEFKTTRIMHFVRPVAMTQADLYGHFFNRDVKRVQILDMATQKTMTWEGPVDKNRAEGVLGDFSKVDGGWIPRAPKTWKCQYCAFTTTCPIAPKELKRS